MNSRGRNATSDGSTSSCCWIVKSKADSKNRLEPKYEDDKKIQVERYAETVISAANGKKKGRRLEFTK